MKYVYCVSYVFAPKEQPGGLGFGCIEITSPELITHFEQVAAFHKLINGKNPQATILNFQLLRKERDDWWVKFWKTFRKKEKSAEGRIGGDL